MVSSSSYDQILESTQKPKLREAFKHLKSHACKVANFTLQWQDLEDHLRFIHSEIESKLKQNPAIKSIQNDIKPPTKDLIFPQNKNPESKATQIPVKNGKELIFYIKQHAKNRRLLQDNLFKLFKDVDGPEKLVVEAVKESYSLPDTDMRWICVVVLEEFGRVREEVDDDVAEEVREEAKRLAVEWRGKLRMGNSLEVWAFLLLLIDFGLVGEFGFDEILELFYCVSSRKHAPELFRALGFAEKAPEYIQKLIAKNMRLEAVRFVYAFELVDQFPPVPLLKGHANYAKEVAKEICNKGKNSFKAQRYATNSEVTALSGIIRFIENYNLGSEYSSEMLRNQIQQMKEQIKKERKANTKTTGSNTKSQLNNKNKSSSPAPQAERNQRRRIRQTVDPNASVNISPPVNSKQPSDHEPTTLFVGQYAQNSTLPPRIHAPSQAFPNAYVGATSNAHIKHSPDQAVLLASHHLTSSFNNYHRAGSTPNTLYTNSSPGLYERSVATHGSSAQFGLAGSATTRPHTSSLPGLYEKGVTTNGSSGQFGLAGSATIHPHTSSLPGLYDRGVTTNGSSGKFGLAGFATIRPHTSSLPGLYERGVTTNGSSGQFGLAATHRPMAGAAYASTNISFPHYGDDLRTSTHYNRQASSSTWGIARPNTSFNRSGCYNMPVSSGGNYGVSSQLRPSIYHP